MLGMTRWTPWTIPRQSVDSFTSFTPAADVRREGDTWTLSIAVPGIPPDKLDIDIVGRTFRVRGERSSEEKTESVMSEIVYGRFEREFTLPDDIDAQRVQATYRYGMLELVLPLKESIKPHRIEVKAAPETKQLDAA
jgi:HSP20 family protein